MKIALSRRKKSESMSFSPEKSVSFKKRFKNSIPLYVLLLPAIIYLVTFHYIPLYGLQIAFKNYNVADGITGSDWVGFDHFIRFFGSARFWTLIKNTLTINVLSLVTFPVPVILALMLNYCTSKRLSKGVQMLTYAPHFISVVVLVSMVNIFFSPSVGVFGQAISSLTGNSINVLTDPGAFKYLFIGSGLWQSVGWGSIIYIGALTAVSPELHEAAVIDGASKLQRIWHIDLPSIAFTLIIMFIMQIGQMMNLGFQKVFLMQNAVNLPVSEVVSTYVYKVGLIQSNFSYSTAIELFNTVINLTLLIIANKVAKKMSGMSLY